MNEHWKGTGKTSAFAHAWNEYCKNRHGVYYIPFAGYSLYEHGVIICTFTKNKMK